MIGKEVLFTYASSAWELTSVTRHPLSPPVLSLSMSIPYCRIPGFGTPGPWPPLEEVVLYWNGP